MFVSTSDELIYSIQEVHPFYYIRNTLLEEDLVKALELIVKEFQKEYSDLFGNDLVDLYNTLCESPGIFMAYYYGYFSIC